jgi:hypothetical protein
MGLAALLGLGQGGMLGGLGNAAPVGQVAVSPLGVAPRGLSASAVSSLNSQLSALAQAVMANPGLFGPPANPTQTAMLRGTATLGTGDPNAAPTNMGYPSVEGVSPGVTAAPAGPTQGSPSVVGPAGPNGPSVAASEVGDVASGLGPAAQTAQAQTNAATPSSTTSTPATTAPPSSPTTPDMGGIFQLLLSLFAGQPELSNLAQNATMMG